jgi:magnesium chelatase subunit H
MEFLSKPVIVAVNGLENFNRSIWDDVRAELAPDAELRQFTDGDVRTPELEAALAEADCVFLSMLNIKSDADWLAPRVDASRTKTVFAYESMPEIMQLTRVGDYQMRNTKGMPPALRKIARMLAGGREEDTLYGFTKMQTFMKAGMKFMPAKMKDFKNWMTVQLYWNQPLATNIAQMFRFILREYNAVPVTVKPSIDIPTMGAYHPDAPEFFKDVKALDKWLAKRDKNAHRAGRVGILMFRKHLIQERSYIDDTIRAFEAANLQPVPVFVAGIEGHVAVREWFTHAHLDFICNTIGFALIGGPAGATQAGKSADIAREILATIDVPYVVTQPLYMQNLEQWRANGVGPVQATMLFNLPEMDGATMPIVLGAIDDGRFRTVPERLERLAGLASKWIALRKKQNREKKVAIVVYDFPPGVGKKATAALLDVPASVLAILRRLEREGYDVGTLPNDRDELLAMVERMTEFESALASGVKPNVVTRDDYRAWTSPWERQEQEERWGAFPGEVAPVGRESLFIGGLRFGKIFIGIQPRLAVDGDPMRLLFDKKSVPHHQYLSFYRYVSRGFGADAMVHVGMHGSVEWLPGLQLGLTGHCWSDALLGEVPHLYLYAGNNPSESTLAKRRGLATMISHGMPPTSRAGLYKELMVLKDVLADYRSRDTGEASAVDADFEDVFARAVSAAHIDDDLPRLPDEALRSYASRLYAYLQELDQKLISDTLHTFGSAAAPEAQRSIVTETVKARGGEHALAHFGVVHLAKGIAVDYTDLGSKARKGDERAMAARNAIDAACVSFVERAVFGAGNVAEAALAFGTTIDAEMQTRLEAIAADGRKLRDALSDNGNELDSVVRGLRGGWIEPGPAGDLIRDGDAVLPTGRNMHAVDPWRLPTETAWVRGAAIADRLIARHQEENDGAYPETIAQVLWGLDTIKTRGEAVSACIHLMGGTPMHDGQGKIASYDLVPLAEMTRPRIDVLMNVSPVFRDQFGLLMDYLDDLVLKCAAAEEDPERNFIRKHVLAEVANGATMELATARIFTQGQGDYGNYVDDLVDEGAWKDDSDLESMFLKRNAFVYGNKRNGANAAGTLDRLLGSVGRVCQEVDSIEFGVSDIDHYFSSSGALYLAAKKRAKDPTKVKLNYVESFTAETRIDDVEAVLRTEYRTKLLNPKWYEGMLQSGNSGAAEISNRMTYMLGWDAVSNKVDDWVYTESAKTFALDEAMRKRLTALNPQAMQNITNRLLEANGRGLWSADAEMIEQLKAISESLEDALEGVC